MVAFEWIAWRLFVVALCAAMFIRLQCFGPPRLQPEIGIEAAFSYLVTPDEVTTYKASLLARAAEKSTRCARPVLRGEPLPGPATNDQLAFDAPPIAPCIDDWRKTLDQPPSTEPTPKQLEVIGRCAPTLDAGLRAAIGHADGCSAHGLGGPEPSELGTALFAGQLLGRHARELAKTDAPNALWILVELIRFGQDQARGRTDLLMAMLGTAIEHGAITNAHEILDRGKPANLDELVTAIDSLLATEPSFGEAAMSDTPRMAIDLGVAALEPASWIPPGGKRSQQAKPANAADPVELGRAVQLVVFGNEFPAKIARACPADASLATCFTGLGLPVAPIESDGSPRSLVRQALAEATVSQVLFTLRDYAVKRAAHHSELIALRLRLEVMRSGCDRTKLAKLATTPTLGDAVQLDYAPDALVVRPPAWASGRFDDEPPRRIACATGTP